MGNGTAQRLPKGSDTLGEVTDTRSEYAARLAALETLVTRLAEGQKSLEWESAQTRGLVLERRATEAEMRETLDRELGDARRAQISLQNRVDRVERLQVVVGSLVREVERLSFSVEIGSSTVSV